jgi:hypothetical protein
MEKRYEINEKDVESTINWLKINDPENANREKAIAMLEDLQAGFHQMSHNNPDLLSGLGKELDSSEPTSIKHKR